MCGAFPAFGGRKSIVARSVWQQTEEETLSLSRLKQKPLLLAPLNSPLPTHYFRHSSDAHNLHLGENVRNFCAPNWPL